jgi:high-affinity iron transporter
MARNLFSVPIFFVVFRATLEAAIILSVLFALVEQIIAQDNYSPVNTALVRDSSDEKDGHPNNTPNAERSPSDNDLNARRRLLRKLRIQV